MTPTPNSHVGIVQIFQVFRLKFPAYLTFAVKNLSVIFPESIKRMVRKKMKLYFDW